MLAIINREELSYGIFNIGSGKMTMVRQVAEWALHFDVHLPRDIEYTEGEATMIESHGLDCTGAFEILGSAPEIDIEEGICRTVER